MLIVLQGCVLYTPVEALDSVYHHCLFFHQLVALTFLQVVALTLLYANASTLIVKMISVLLNRAVTSQFNVRQMVPPVAVNLVGVRLELIVH